MKWDQEDLIKPKNLGSAWKCIWYYHVAKIPMWASECGVFDPYERPEICPHCQKETLNGGEI